MFSLIPFYDLHTKQECSAILLQNKHTDTSSDGNRKMIEYTAVPIHEKSSIEIRIRYSIPRTSKLLDRHQRKNTRRCQGVEGTSRAMLSIEVRYEYLQSYRSRIFRYIQTLRQGTQHDLTANRVCLLASSLDGGSMDLAPLPPPAADPLPFLRLLDFARALFGARAPTHARGEGAERGKA